MLQDLKGNVVFIYISAALVLFLVVKIVDFGVAISEALVSYCSCSHHALCLREKTFKMEYGG